ncbi:hypothetical protein GF371_05060 [Candidatus Woesearchaeota archaeon]|nr:hypothetical protein [Candidatus Woesearchaeota archaeon]
MAKKMAKRHVMGQVTQVTSASPFGGGKQYSTVVVRPKAPSGTGPEMKVKLPVGTEPALHSFVVVAPLGAATTGKKFKWKIVKRGVNPADYM